MKITPLLFLLYLSSILSNHIKTNAQSHSNTLNILAYTNPENVQVNAEKLNQIDTIIQQALKEKATPGAIILVAKSGKIIFHKAYGYKTYSQLEKVTPDDIYDLASITKIAATTLATMLLFDQHKIDLNAHIDTYLPALKGTNKATITIKDLLLHQAGLVPFIPFYKDLKTSDWQRNFSTEYPTQVADSFFIKKNFFELEMWPTILNSPIKTPNKYVYSDLSMYLMRAIIEKKSSLTLQELVYKTFYEPLGLETMNFKPLQKTPRLKIVPSEVDTIFRKQEIRGFVHDPGAALAGGIAGHAGLFSNAKDLATISQMLLQHGEYNGKRYLNPTTVTLFTSKQSTISRRGLGFDKRDADTTKHYPSRYASETTFGHTGFTGTCVWIDPEHELIYIFLSNRLYPYNNSKLNTLNIRSRIHDVIYEAILNYKK